jgi:hypothetical protein
MKEITLYITFKATDVHSIFLHPRNPDAYITEDLASADIIAAIAAGFQWIRTDGDYAIFEKQCCTPPPTGSTDPVQHQMNIRKAIIQPLHKKPSKLPTWRHLLNLLRIGRDLTAGAKGHGVKEVEEWRKEITTIENNFFQ